MNKQRTDRPTKVEQRQTTEQNKTDKQIKLTKSDWNTDHKATEYTQNGTGRHTQQTHKEQLKGADLNTPGNQTY